MNELFQIKTVKQDSPRLAWMKLHKLKTKKSNDLNEVTEDEFSNDIYPWYANATDETNDEGFCGGLTEDEAITNWARWKGVRLWNEINVSAT